MRIFNGLIEEFFVLGDLSGTYYIADNGAPIITNPSQAKRFNNYGEASDYYKRNKNNYNDYLYPQGIRIIVQLI